MPVGFTDADGAWSHGQLHGVLQRQAEAENDVDRCGNLFSNLTFR